MAYLEVGSILQLDIFDGFFGVLANVWFLEPAREESQLVGPERPS